MTRAPEGQEAILEELSALGLHHDSLSDLRHSGTRYTAAVPVLVRRLPDADARTQEQLTRALSVPWARPTAIGPLLDLFRATSDESLRWIVGNALDVVADDSVIDDLMQLASNPAYGTSREMVVTKLGKSKDPRVVDALVRLAEDPDVDGHAVDALARRRHAPSAADVFARFRDDHRAWVRKAARRGLAKLGPS